MNISDVTEKTGISTDTLRYYEKIGLIPPVRRTAGGLRDYGEADLNWIEYIKCMRNAGVAIEQLIKYVGLFGQGEATVEARKQILLHQREEIAARVAELQRTLDFLDHKIASYESRMMLLEQELADKANLRDAERA